MGSLIAFDKMTCCNKDWCSQPFSMLHSCMSMWLCTACMATHCSHSHTLHHRLLLCLHLTWWPSLSEIAGVSLCSSLSVFFSLIPSEEQSQATNGKNSISNIFYTLQNPASSCQGLHTLKKDSRKIQNRQQIWPDPCQTRANLITLTTERQKYMCFREDRV